MASSNRRPFVVYRSRQQTDRDLSDNQALRHSVVSSQVGSASSVSPTQSPSKKSLFSVPVVPVKTEVLQSTKTHGGQREDHALHDRRNDNPRSHQLMTNRSEPTLPYSQKQHDGAGKFSDKRQSTSSASSHSVSCLSQGSLFTEHTSEKMPTSNKPARTARAYQAQIIEETKAYHAQISEKIRAFYAQRSEETRPYHAQRSEETRPYDTQRSEETRPYLTQRTEETRPYHTQRSEETRPYHAQRSVETRMKHTVNEDRDCSLSRHGHAHQLHQHYSASTPNLQSAVTQQVLDDEQRGANLSHREHSKRQPGPCVVPETGGGHVLHEVGHIKANKGFHYPDGRESIKQRDQRSRFDKETTPKEETRQRYEHRNAVKTDRVDQKVKQKQDERKVHKEAPQKAEGTKSKTDMKRTDSQKCRQKHDKGTPHPTTLYVRIHKVITNIDVLVQILTEKVNTQGVELKPTETAISDTYTYCSLPCDSHKKAQKLKGLILKNKRQFHPHIDCSFVDYQRQPTLPDDHHHNQQHNQAENLNRKSKQQQNQAATKEILKEQVHFEMKKLSERALLNHQKMMDDVEKKLDESKSKLGDKYGQKDTMAEIAAHERKLVELQKQKQEFTTAFERFQSRLVPMLDSDTYEQDVKLLRKKLGVECHRLDKALPMYAHRQDVVQRVKQHPVTVLLAETGSGKSTQVVQYLMEAGLAEHGTIVCTQPRKVAVISLATHVAEELATNVGLEVGYKAGLKTKTSASTKIVYMTDHALLNECLKDPDLQAFSCVVVDEAHERSLYTDLLLTMVKRCMHNRPDLRVIITSATIDPDVFVNFFGSCPVMRVSGRAFPVDVVWEDSASEETDFENYVDAAVNKVVDIHRKAPPGDILVFLTSAAEIEKCCIKTQQRLKDCDDFKCLPLHGQLQSDEQQKVFKRLDRGARKIVYATNCAETSITIDGIKYVVDTGVAKEMLYDARKGFNSLVVTTISKSSAEQRKGRAGRTAPGTCYRLYSRHSFQAMDSISLPDILKIHLGHALLTLAQLGFTPAMYDFVQSPAQDAIEAALKTLRQLGALDDGDNITDTGQWIVRLPFDPKLGLIILRGQECGLLYDAIVLASVMNAGKGLFYRGTSEADRKKMDKARLKFSQQGGDGLSSLEVYKAWQAVDDRNKTRWCLANSVNAKAIRGVRESTKEVIDVLRKEVKLDIPEKFSDSPDAADKLRKIIFQCNISALCHFLGKERAGYFAAQACRQVHFHPSSALCSLAYNPQWVVYDQLLKTSRDFITGITPVDDSWLEEINFKPYGFDMDQVRQKTLGNVFTQPAGCHAFFAMIGPRYSKLRQYEEELCGGSESGDIVVIEGSKDMGQLKVFSTGPPQSVAPLRDTLTHVVDEAVQEVKGEVRELTLGTEDSGLRVVVGQGGQLTDFLMPHETRKIIVTRPADDTTEEDIRNKFEMFGKICYIHQFPSGRNWGFVVYDTPAEAETAAQVTKHDEDNVGELERRRTAKQAIFKAKLFWCRRPCNGRGFVDVSPAYMPDLLALRGVFIGNNPVTIKVSRKQPEDSLHLGGLPEEVSEDLIQRSLLHHLGCGENEKGIISRVTIIRNNVGKTTKGELQKLQQALQASFKARLRVSSVEVKVFTPRDERTTRFSGEACFTDPIEGFAACKALQRRLTLNNVPVNIEPICSATVRIQRRIYEACKVELESLFDGELKNIDVEIENKDPQQNVFGNKGPRNGVDSKASQNVVLHLRADNMKCIVEARTFINDVIKPAWTVDCHGDLIRSSLMAPAGQKKLREIQSSTAAYICVDSRTRTVTLHGSANDCTPVLIAINAYLDEVEQGNVQEVTLRGSGRPPGLLKALVNKYHEDLDTLRQDTGLLTITINYRFHTLKLVGPRESLDQAKAAVEAVSDQLLEGSQRREGEGEESVDCVTCLCPIDTGDLYRLEACAHPYCIDCLKHQVSVAIRDHQLPVTCAQEDCGEQLAWRDFNALARLRHIKLPDLASSALSAYILTNRDKASFCATPNCQMAYRLTSEQDAKTFQCSQCGVRVCTCCKAQAHEGITCAMLRSAEKERSGLDEWVSKDRKNHKICPGCDSPIAKDGGCNKMMCGACKTIFCWLCRKTFPNDERCYEHLRLKHGGVFTLADILYDE